VTEEDLVVPGNPDALKQLMLILLDNAIKYTPPPGQVTIAAERQDGEVHISVIDTGVGIDPVDLPRIFEPFYRADSAREAEGSGLGLAIGRWIAEQHSARIEIASTPDHGSRFTVRLPASADYIAGLTVRC
jgi:signal transduction histidine kinase